MRANAGGTCLAERRGERWMVLDLAKAVRERVGIVGIDEDAAASRLENFREGTPARLHDRNARRHRFEQKNSFRLSISGGDRHDVEAPQERNLSCAVQLAAILEFRRETSLFHLARELLEICRMLRRQISGNEQTGLCASRRRPESTVCVAEYVQALFRRDTREKPHRKRARGLARPKRVPIQVYSERRETHLRFRQAEITGHVVGVVAADR